MTLVIYLSYSKDIEMKTNIPVITDRNEMGEIRLKEHRPLWKDEDFSTPTDRETIDLYKLLYKNAQSYTVSIVNEFYNISINAGKSNFHSHSPYKDAQLVIKALEELNVKEVNNG